MAWHSGVIARTALGWMRLRCQLEKLGQVILFCGLARNQELNVFPSITTGGQPIDALAQPQYIMQIPNIGLNRRRWLKSPPQPMGGGLLEQVREKIIFFVGC